MSASSRRVIAHLDMDAFYASVELLRYPELRGQPVVIGGGRRHQPQGEPGARRFAVLRDYVGRGVVTTATYAARTFGVHSGMGLMKAAKLAPQAVLLPVDFDQYRHYSRQFKAAVRSIAPQIEDRGIDEIYIDFTDHLPSEGDLWHAAGQHAARIKQAVQEATGLTCSVGVTPNKLLSKLASDLDKPDGLTVLRPGDLERRIWPLAVSKVNGIGPKASAKLERLGIRTIGELAAADLQWLMSQFGQNTGAWLHEAAHGRDDRSVVTVSEPKSISRETTFERDLHPVRDRAILSGIFTELCVLLAGDLERKRYAGKTIGLKLRFDDFKTVTRDCTIEWPTQDAAAIRRAAGQCLRRVPMDRKLRLLGVRVGALVKVDAVAEPGAPYVADAAVPRNLSLF
jgi:DNA polymerase-4